VLARAGLIDQHLDPEHPDGVAAVADLHMMAVCEGGRERDPDQVQALMRDAGLKPGKVRHAGLQMLVEGMPDSAQLATDASKTPGSAVRSKEHSRRRCTRCCCSSSL
jgi:hypothetical protein